MDQRQFEQSVLQYVHARRVDRLTPAAVSREFGLSVKDAEKALDRMVTEGTLELDSDDEGNLFYFVPGLGTAGVFTQGTSAANPAEAPRPPQGAPTGGPAPWTPPPSGGPQGAPGGYGAPPANAPYGQQPPGGYGNRYQGGGAPTYGPPPGAPPQNPYGQQPPQNPYGQQPPQNPYGQQPPQHPYGQQPGYAPTQSGAPTGYGNPYSGQQPYGQQPGYGQQPYTQNAYGQQPYAYGQNALVPAGQYAPRSPAAASLLSTFFPGAGQLYNGQVGKGMFFFFSTVMLVALGPVCLVPWLWGIADAYSTTRRANQQQQPYGLLPHQP